VDCTYQCWAATTKSSGIKRKKPLKFVGREASVSTQQLLEFGRRIRIYERRRRKRNPRILPDGIAPRAWALAFGGTKHKNGPEQVFRVVPKKMIAETQDCRVVPKKKK
jgi:hypothetical protein